MKTGFQLQGSSPPGRPIHRLVAAKFRCPDLCKVEMSVAVVRCVMWKPPLFGGFQGLWEEWDSFIVPHFPSGRHFHRFRFSFAFSIIDLLTIGLDLWDILYILLGLDEGESMSEPLVLNDSGVVDSLVLVEEPVGKHLSLPPHLQPSIREVIQIHVLAA